MAPASVEGAGSCGSTARATCEGVGGGGGAARAREAAPPVGGPSCLGAGRPEAAAGSSDAPPHVARSQTAGMSNTVCVSDAVGEWAVVGAKLVQDLSKFGEVARLDAIGGTLGTVLATYFDVRCAQSALLHMASRAEPFQSAPQDCRIVLVDLLGFFAKTGYAARLQDFGEVAHVDMYGALAAVEFYDLRSARALWVAAGDCATPVSNHHDLAAERGPPGPACSPQWARRRGEPSVRGPTGPRRLTDIDGHVGCGGGEGRSARA
ncbi:unnamed protein product [Prorocentrum cordatum]|uniref:Uncharacterized protein n=1 Tax=Prorocentrum cordatum TaxID=2364126 RepID=A0ABN9QE56_9DINO|nr:unnamed protein product [Polarella glacialis]